MPTSSLEYSRNANTAFLAYRERHRQRTHALAAHAAGALCACPVCLRHVAQTQQPEGHRAPPASSNRSSGAQARARARAGAGGYRHRFDGPRGSRSRQPAPAACQSVGVQVRVGRQGPRYASGDREARQALLPAYGRFHGCGGRQAAHPEHHLPHVRSGLSTRCRVC